MNVHLGNFRPCLGLTSHPFAEVLQDIAGGGACVQAYLIEMLQGSYQRPESVTMLGSQSTAA